MKCPACKNPLREKGAGGMTLDICYGGCGGIWFDALELDRVSAQAATTLHSIWAVPSTNVKLSVEPLNGVRNRAAAGGTVREADPDFVRALELMREVQAAGAVGMRVEEDKAKRSTAVLFFRRDDVAAEIGEKAVEVRRLLKLPAERQQYVLTYSPVRGAEGELAVNSRSMLQIMTAFSICLYVPEAHLKDPGAMPAFPQNH